MVKTSFSDANILNIFSGGSLLPGHTVVSMTTFMCAEWLQKKNTKKQCLREKIKSPDKGRKKCKQ